ncbi:sensor histidine kinase [Microvirga thermotolerans]|uniref:sensor histidine kinase n=1 Tax=Microvirga thermotolerans TaxID=2651334 RepID=UPI001884625F|nr:response regulator [Microvirga thermotolerans]
MSPTPNPLPEAPLRILLLEDSALDAELVAEILAEAGMTHRITRVVSAQEFLQAVGQEEWDLILADYVLPGFDGLAALAMARERRPQTPFIFVSGALGEEIAVEALKLGATDFVVKQRLERLPATLLRALSEASERRQRQQAQAELHRLLAERTALLHELDHRVKNNLQLLVSLVGMEMRQAESEEARRTLWRMRERLQALGMAHRDLYDGQGARLFDAASFARDLCMELTAAPEAAGITPEFALEAVGIGAAKAAPLALLFNEIVFNALAHAYAGRKGKLKLRMTKQDGRLVFAIADDAFSPGEKEAARRCSTGKILRALALQLDATVEWPEEDPQVLVRVSLPAGGEEI